MSVGVIIVNYFTEDLIRPLLSRLEKFYMIGEVVIFNNGSHRPVTSDHAHVRIMGDGCNLGFAAAVNRAYCTLDAEYILLLNPDVSLDVIAVERLLQAARLFRCPIVGPRYYWDEQRVFRLSPATGASRWLGVGAASPNSLDGQLRSYFWAKYHDQYWLEQKPFRIPFLPGACVLLEGQWLRQRGKVFDERYFMYYEDTDLCLEAHLSGWFPMCVPGAEVVHYWDQSPQPQGGKARLLLESERAFLQKFGLTVPDPVGSLPSLPAVNFAPPMEMGDHEDPIRLPIRRCPKGTRFEVGAEAGFVPFAQAQLGGQGWRAFSGNQPPWTYIRQVGGYHNKTGDFSFPRKVWTRLQEGRYFARLRLPDGSITDRWTWRRTRS